MNYRFMRKGIRAALGVVAACALFVSSTSAQAGVLDGFSPVVDGWTGSVPFDNGAGLSGFIDYAVMTEAVFNANFAGLGYVPTLGQLVYTYQLTSTGADTISVEVVGIANPANTIGSFDIGDVAPSVEVLNPTDATWAFTMPGIQTGETSWGLAFSSPKVPVAGSSLTINGGGSALVGGVPTPGPVDFPEPASMAMIAVGGLLIAGRRR